MNYKDEFSDLIDHYTVKKFVIKYDYSVCSRCGSKKTYPVTNDGGSVGGCLECKRSFISRKVKKFLY